MNYGNAEQAVAKIKEAIEICNKLIEKLTEEILQTSVGSITTLQEKITKLKTTLEAAQTDIESTVTAMKGIESDVKG